MRFDPTLNLLYREKNTNKFKTIELQIESVKARRKNEEKLCKRLQQEVQSTESLIRLQREKFHRQESDYKSIVNNARMETQKFKEQALKLRGDVADALISHYQKGRALRTKLANNIKSQESAHREDLRNASEELAHYTNTLLGAEVSHHNLICMMKLEHEEIIKSRLLKAAKELHYMQSVYHHKIHTIREKWNDTKEATSKQHQLEDMKEIMEAQEQHENRIKALKGYFDNLQAKNWKLIKDLNAKMEQLKVIEAKKNKILEKAETQYRSLARPFDTTSEELSTLDIEVKSIKGKTDDYAKLCIDTKQKERDLQMLQLKADTVQLKLSQLQEDHRALLERSQLTQYRLRQRSALKTLFFKLQTNFARSQQSKLLANSAINHTQRLGGVGVVPNELRSSLKGSLYKQAHQVEVLQKKHSDLEQQKNNSTKLYRNAIAAHGVYADRRPLTSFLHNTLMAHGDTLDSFPKS